MLLSESEESGSEKNVYCIKIDKKFAGKYELKKREYELRKKFCKQFFAGLYLT